MYCRSHHARREGGGPWLRAALAMAPSRHDAPGNGVSRGVRSADAPRRCRTRTGGGPAPSGAFSGPLTSARRGARGARGGGGGSLAPAGLMASRLLLRSGAVKGRAMVGAGPSATPASGSGAQAAPITAPTPRPGPAPPPIRAAGRGGAAISRGGGALTPTPPVPGTGVGRASAGAGQSGPTASTPITQTAPALGATGAPVVASGAVIKAAATGRASGRASAGSVGAGPPLIAPGA